jgi:xanthine dehydrogenase accessory factor
MLDIYTEIIERQRQGRRAVLVTVVAVQGHTPAELQGKMLVGAGGRLCGTVGGGALEQKAIERARAVLAERKPLLQVFHLDTGDHEHGESTGMICGGQVTLFFELIGSGVPTYLFGAGHVGRALADTLAPLGFSVTLIDCRPEQLADLAFPTLAAGSEYSDLPDLPDLADAYVVIATHSHVCDACVLVQILSRAERPAYLGVVASRRKRDQMLASVRTHLGPDRHGDLSWIHIPVGLHLGGNTPAALALSIAAEMQAHRHGITGHAHMRDRKKPGPEARP